MKLFHKKKNLNHFFPVCGCSHLKFPLKTRISELGFSYCNVVQSSGQGLTFLARSRLTFVALHNTVSPDFPRAAVYTSMLLSR